MIATHVRPNEVHLIACRQTEKTCLPETKHIAINLIIIHAMHVETETSPKIQLNILIRGSAKLVRIVKI